MAHLLIENHRINYFYQLHWPTAWMKSSANCGKCQRSSVIEGCVQELLDPSLATSCCMQTSTETHQRALASPSLLLLLRPHALTSSSANDFCSFFLHLSPHIGPCVCCCCLPPATTVGLVLEAESRCEHWANQACFVKSNWQFATTPSTHTLPPSLMLLPLTGLLFK